MNPELQLRDIHLPPEPSWWPPAPGWWLLALLIALFLYFAGRYLLRSWRRRQRLGALNAEFDALLGVADAQARLAGISQLLRRAARLHEPASAMLSGDAWLSFLDQAMGDSAGTFSQGAGRALLDGPYRRDPDIASMQALIAPARLCYLNLAEPSTRRSARRALAASLREPG